MPVQRIPAVFNPGRPADKDWPSSIRGGANEGLPVATEERSMATKFDPSPVDAIQASSRSGTSGPAEEATATPPALTDADRAELTSRWDRMMLDGTGIAQLREDFRRALMKHGHDPEETNRKSASATCAELARFFTEDLAGYAVGQRKGRQTGGRNSPGLVESTSKPSPDRVHAAINRELQAGTSPSEIPRKVQKGGIKFSIKWIRMLGQRAGLLPLGKGKR